MLLWKKPVWSRPVLQWAIGFYLSRFVSTLFLTNEADLLATNTDRKPKRYDAELIVAAMGFEHASVHRDEFGFIACVERGDKSRGDREWDRQRHGSGRGPIQLVSASMALSQFVWLLI